MIVDGIYGHDEIQSCNSTKEQDLNIQKFCAEKKLITVRKKRINESERNDK